MLKGIKLEEDVVAAMSVPLAAKVPEIILPGRDAAWRDCCVKLAEIVRGGVYQEKVWKETVIGNYSVFLYGKVDFIKRDYIYDIKFTQGYDIGKYADSIQHDLYMLCANIPNFAYLVSDGRNIYQEGYSRSAKSQETMFTRIATMLNDIFADQDFAHLYDAHWTSLNKAA